MTPSSRLSTAMATLRWGVSSFAGAARVSDRTVQRWLAAQNEPPEALLAWVERLAAVHSANPPPERIRRGE